MVYVMKVDIFDSFLIYVDGSVNVFLS